MNCSSRRSRSRKNERTFDRVLEPRERGLAGQVVGRDGAVAKQLENRIAAQHVVVVLVGVVGEDAVHPHSGHLQEGMIDVADMSPVRQGFGKLPCQTDPLVELAERQQPGIAGNLFRRGHYHNRFGCGKIKRQLKSGLRNHLVPPCLCKVRVHNTLNATGGTLVPQFMNNSG